MANNPKTEPKTEKKTAQEAEAPTDLSVSENVRAVQAEDLEGRPSQMATYSDLFERLVEPSFILDLENFTILDLNPVAEELIGQTISSACGRKLTDWVPDKERDYFIKALRIARRKYYAREFEATWLGEEGKRAMKISACVLKLKDDSEVLQVIFNDVTAQKEAEAQITTYLDNLEAANRKLQALSVTDELTGLSNVRYFKSQLREEHERANRFGTPYAIVFLDVDHFKNYNDSHGHQAGDVVLKDFGKLLRQLSRKTDMPARYGGEEFVVLCRGVDSTRAKKLADRLQEKIQEYPFPHREEQPLGFVSASIGVANYPDHGETAEEVLKAADDSVYRAKKAGRNRVAFASDAEK